MGVYGMLTAGDGLLGDAVLPPGLKLLLAGSSLQVGNVRFHITNFTALF